MAWGIAMISDTCRQPGDGSGFRDSSVDWARLKETVGPGRRFPFSLPRTENAGATRKSKNTILLY
jgi:hypothetical protein